MQYMDTSTDINIFIHAVYDDHVVDSKRYCFWLSHFFWHVLRWIYDR